ncbi:TRAP transporter permease [Natronorubrum sp. FCH18a]|uniref:TRAP transporter permease n=1 Tax=Natronorubrum sp. FCH18a TaxID=3447018 RepID=UPI003F513A92
MSSNRVGIPLHEEPLLVGKYTALVFLGIIGTLYHLWFSVTFGVEMNQHMVVHLGLMMVVICVISIDPEINRDEGLIAYVDNVVVLPLQIIASTGITYYLWTNYSRLAHDTIGIYSDTDVLVGALLLLLILDQSRRAFGLILPAVGAFGIVYAYAGPYFPGILGHGGITPKRIVTSTTVEFVGVFDTLVEVAATYIVIFIIFAGFLEAYGAMNYFVQVGAKAGRYVRSGITQTAVVTSIGMGSVNGSAAANAATTGAFTIPLMKNQGIDEDTAAAIESVASSGGQIMPPIMGAAAFIMAEITGTRYVHIITIGLLPALLFYGSVVVAVHLITIKEGAGLTELRETDTSLTDEGVDAGPGESASNIEDVSLGSQKQPDEIDIVRGATDKSIFRSLAEGLYLWIPVAVLIFTLIVLQYDPLYAGFFATASIFPVALAQNVLLGDDWKAATRDFAENTVEGCRLGISNAAPITLAVAAIAIFVGALSLTGFTQALAQGLISMSGGVLVLLLVFAMIAAIVFGLGMPTVAAYIVAVLLIAPALSDMGLRLETAHFFVFYFAILSAITPPVAIACIITSEIAKGNFWRVCFKAMALGLPLFLLPYVFVVNDSILYWTFPETVIVFPILFLGMVAVSVSIVNYLTEDITLPVRIGFGVLGLAILFAPLLPVNTFATHAALIAALAGLMLYEGVLDSLKQFVGGIRS